MDAFYQPLDFPVSWVIVAIVMVFVISHNDTDCIYLFLGETGQHDVTDLHSVLESTKYNLATNVEILKIIEVFYVSVSMPSDSYPSILQAVRSYWVISCSA